MEGLHSVSVGGGGDDELMSLLRQYEAAGGSLDPDQAPPELTSLLREVERKKRGGPAPAEASEEGEDITPEMGFVIKTHDDTGRKVFVNVCGSSKIPAPGNWKGGKVPEKVQQALEKLAEEGNGEAGAEALRFPLSCGDLHNDLDKKGEPASVCDVILNADVVTQCMAMRRLKVFVVELALAWVGQKHQLELDPKYKLPHLHYKGDKPKAQRVRVDPKCLIHELDEPEDEEPSFPLRLTPIPSTVPLPPQGLAQAAAATAATIASAPTRSSPPATTSFSFAEATSAPTSGMLPTLKPVVTYTGRPATEVVVSVTLPASTRIADITAAIASEVVEVVVCGAAPLLVPLPFAVSSVGASVTLHKASDNASTTLMLRLPYRPFTHVLGEARKAAPHAFGALGLSNSFLMDLE